MRAFRTDAALLELGQMKLLSFILIVAASILQLTATVKAVDEATENLSESLQYFGEIFRSIAAGNVPKPNEPPDHKYGNTILRWPETDASEKKKHIFAYELESFRHVQEELGVYPKMMELIVVQPYKRIDSSGASGNEIWFSLDGNYMVKVLKKKTLKETITLQGSDLDQMKRVIKEYNARIDTNPTTLLPAFLLVWTITKGMPDDKDQMNFFLAPKITPKYQKMELVFDLKGSEDGRTEGFNTTYLYGADPSNPKPIKKQDVKDNDYIQLFLPGGEYCNEETSCIEVLHKDYTPFLRDALADLKFQNETNRTDYSMLVSYHNYDAGLENDMAPGDIIEKDESAGRSPGTRSFLRCFPGQLRRKDGKQPDRLAICVGMIDVLQNYFRGKRLENWYKRTFKHQKKASVRGPDHFARRQYDFLQRLFTGVSSSLASDEKTGFSLPALRQMKKTPN